MKVAVFYYTQSGQALDVAKQICAPMEKAGSQVVCRQIVPLQAYPFPWDKAPFFDVFPEARLGMPPSGIQPIDFADAEDADLVIIVGQTWFLSPSLPLQSFLADGQVREYLHGKDVVFVNVCRNMWLMTGRRIKSEMKEMGCRLVGHIVLQDKAPNLISALTIVRWLMFGKKEVSWMLPHAGVPEADIKGASRFGEIILEECGMWNVECGVRNVECGVRNVECGMWNEECGRRNEGQLQSRLLGAGAIRYQPSVLFLEKAGHRMFGFWAKFIRKRGGFGDPRRRTRLNLFFYYLLTVLFLVSPFGQLFFYLTYPLQRVSQHRREDCGV